MSLFLGIDVGTGSARAGLFDAAGNAAGIGSAPIALRSPAPEAYAQSSADIWRACGIAVRAALAEAGASADRIAGLAFDATCSLVLVGTDGAPVGAHPADDDAWDIIVWMDHRAVAEAAAIDAAGHELLARVGGTISPEMQLPKLLWLRDHHRAGWDRTRGFFDLADWLAWRATGAGARSLCTTVCKWGYVGEEGRWAPDWFASAGLSELADEGFIRIGTQVLPIGAPTGVLGETAAAELGLAAGIPVAIGAIDAHAGAIGTLGGSSEFALERRLAMIAGTSSCHLQVSAGPRFVPGVWGPYWGALVPDFWLNEGGQTATGAVIDRVIDGHAESAALRTRAVSEGRDIYALLGELAAAPEAVATAAALHVLPDFHGNRAPLADPAVRGIIAGLPLDGAGASLPALYRATLEGVALGTRLIVERMDAHGGTTEAIVLSGGQGKNPLFVRILADATGLPVLLPRADEAMLLGGAMIAATGAGAFPGLTDAMTAMSGYRATIDPDPARARYFGAKTEVLKRMYADEAAYRAIMAAVA